MPTVSVDENTILKLKIADDIRRVKLHHEAGQVLTYDKISQAIAQTWPELPAYKASYRDGEGDLCTLTPETVSDFVGFATVVSDETILKLELHPESSKVAEPTKAEEPTSQKVVPSLLCAFLHLFTMGFNKDRAKVLNAQGPMVLANKIKAEAQALSVVCALLWKDIVTQYFQISNGSWDKLFNEGTAVSFWWYLYAGLCTLSLVCLSSSLFCNILLLVTMNNLIESKVETFLKVAGWTMKIPYLGGVYGLVFYCAAWVLLSYFATDGKGWFTFVAVLFLIGASVIFFSGARYVHGTYVAD